MEDGNFEPNVGRELALREVAANLPAALADEIAAARGYADASRSPATRRAYASDWRTFTAWCETRQFGALPAEPAVVALFLAAEAARGVAASSLNRRLAAIAYYHRRAGEVAPQHGLRGELIAEQLAGIRRTHGSAVVRKSPARASVLLAMLATIVGDGVRARRDRAVLALGIAGAFRRSELVGLTRGDVELVDEGLRVTIRSSKTDQSGAGAVIAIPKGQRIRPKQLMLAWLDSVDAVEGVPEAGAEKEEVTMFRGRPLFRQLSRGDKILSEPMSDRFVARLVQRCAFAAGYAGNDYAGHSLRSGFLTEAARQGATVFKMRDVSRHRSLQVLADYVQDAELFDDHAGEGFL